MLINNVSHFLKYKGKKTRILFVEILIALPFLPEQEITGSIMASIILFTRDKYCKILFGDYLKKKEPELLFTIVNS